jgi:hypothetical protein
VAEKSKEEAAEVSPNLLKLKRGKTKDHVRNLQNLMLRKSEANMSAAAASARSISDSKLAEEHKEQVNVLSHEVYCPERLPRTDEQEEAIAELKKRVADVMIPHFAEQWTYVRFLGARNYDLDKAETLLREAIEWRKNLRPMDDELRDLVSLAMAVQMSGMMKSKDKFGRTIMYFCPRRNNAKMREVDSALRVMVWFMDQLLEETKKTHYQKFVVLFNMSTLFFFLSFVFLFTKPLLFFCRRVCDEKQRSDHDQGVFAHLAKLLSRSGGAHHHRGVPVHHLGAVEDCQAAAGRADAKQNSVYRRR